MKFSDGLWLTKKGYQVHYAVQVYEITHTENSVTVFAVTNPVYHRAMTLGGVTLEITYKAVADDVFKIHIVHHKGALKRQPSFELSELETYHAQIQETENFIQMTAGNTTLSIQKGMQWKTEFSYQGKYLTGNSGRSTSYIEENPFHANARTAVQTEDLFFNPPADSRNAYIREQLSLDVGECIYGFGEKFTPFVKNGQTVEIWNSDGGTCSEQSYKSIPFCLSSKSYGIFVNSSGNVSYEVASDTVSKLSMTLSGEELEYYFFAGQNPEQVLVKYTDLTGKPALPPAETFGLWLSTSFTTDYNEETVNQFIDGMAERNIPLQFFHFDCFWMKPFEWTSFEWDEQNFPDPPAMLNRLHQKGLKTCCWINPYIAQRSALFQEGAEKHYFLHNPDGSIFQTDLWQSGMAIVDFTNPEACKWFANHLRKLFETGIDAIKTDFGERIPTNVVYYNHADPIEMHNYYTYLYNKLVFETLEDYYGKNQACLFARSATAGCQKFPVHWGGDCSAEYTSMAETLRGGLSLTASGFGYFSHDIGGFEQTASADVYKRWCAFGLMSSHSRLHGSTSYRVPWLYEEDTPENPQNACAVLRYFTQLKGKLMPYLFSQAVKTHQTGIPMMKAMILAYPDDPAVKYLDQQYLLGESLLCAPVMNAEGTVDFYLPEGIWTDIITGKSYQGGTFIHRNCNFLEMPILAKQDSIIIYGDFKKSSAYDYIQNAKAVIYNLSDGSTAEATIYNCDAEPELTLKAVRNGSQIVITASQTNKTFQVKLFNGASVTMGNGITRAVLEGKELFHGERERI